MTWVAVLGSVMLAVSAVLVLVRMALGPTTLDRTIGLDVMLSVVICALALEAAYHRHLVTLPVLVALSLLGFAGSVGVASGAGAPDGGADDPDRGGAR